MNEYLMEAVLEYAVFCGLSHNSVLDPDTAVNQLEQLADILGHLSVEDREVFIEYVKTRITPERNGSNPERAEFLGEFLDNIGV